MRITDRMQDFIYYMNGVKQVMEGNILDSPTLLKTVFHNTYYPAMEYIMLENGDEKELKSLFDKINPIVVPYISQLLPPNSFLKYSRGEYNPYYQIVYQNPISLEEKDMVTIDIREKAFLLNTETGIQERMNEIQNLQEEIQNLESMKTQIIDEYDYAKNDTVLERLGKRFSRKSNFKEGMKEVSVVDAEINNILNAIEQIEVEIRVLKEENKEFLTKQEQVRSSLVSKLGLHEKK